MMIDPMKMGFENQTCQFGYEGHTRICTSSIMQSKVNFCSHGGREAKSAHAILEQLIWWVTQ